MPTYDYKCKACSHQFEHFQSMKDAPLRKCPKCGKPALERLIGTGAAILFKGSGFYQTDYRSESYKAAKQAESTSGSGAKPEAGGADKAAAPAESSAKPAEAPKAPATPPKPDKPSGGAAARKAKRGTR